MTFLEHLKKLEALRVSYSKVTEGSPVDGTKKLEDYTSATKGLFPSWLPPVGVTLHEVLVATEDSHVLVTTNIRFSRMATRLWVDIEKHAGGEVWLEGVGQVWLR